MKSTLPTAAALVAALAVSPQVQAEVVSFHFSGGGASGAGVLTVTPDTVAGDPSGAYAISGASGTFSDSNAGISGATITGVTPIDAAPEVAPFPTSLSFLAVSNPPPGDTAISYDNLFYPDGSPIVCPGYPGAGGFLDVYGVMLTLGGGDVVDLFSNGTAAVLPPLSYGAVVIDSSSDKVVDYIGAGIVAGVPEPATWALTLVGVGLVGFGLRRRNRSAPAAA